MANVLVILILSLVIIICAFQAAVKGKVYWQGSSLFKPVFYLLSLIFGVLSFAVSLFLLFSYLAKG